MTALEYKQKLGMSPNGKPHNGKSHNGKLHNGKLHKRQSSSKSPHSFILLALLPPLQLLDVILDILLKFVKPRQQGS